MANRICYPMTDVPKYLVATINVPAGVTLKAGDVVIANTNDATISGNYSVYSPEQPATLNLVKRMAIVINGGFEQLADGRRPDGQPDYTQYEFNEGDVVTVIFLVPELRFQISTDCINGVAAVNDFIFPVDGAYQMDVDATVPVGTFSSLKLLASKYFRLGGQAGAQFAETFVAVVQDPS